MNGHRDKELAAAKERIAFLESELRNSESKWRCVLENTPQIGVSLDPEGRIVFANRHFLELTGWSFNEIYRQNWFDLFLPSNLREDVRRVFLETLRQETVKPFTTYQNEICTRDGLLRTVSWFNVLTFGADGEVVDITCLGIDQTAQEEAESARRINERRLQFALEAANGALWDWNVKTGAVFFSPMWGSMLGYAADELPLAYENWLALVHAEDVDRVQTGIDEHLLGRGAFECEMRMRTKGGDWRWILSCGKIISMAPDGTPLRAVGTHTDIHDRKVAEEALREAYKELNLNMVQLRTLVEVLPELVWLKDINGVYLFCNRRFERLYGATEAEILGKTDYDFRAKGQADFFRAHDIAALSAGKATTIEETVIYADDGHAEDLETIKTPLYGDDGVLVGVLGVGRDITERNRIAEELKQSEARYKALHNASFGGLFIHSEGTILDCNQGLVDMTGYIEEELVGMRGLLLFAERCRSEVRDNFLMKGELAYESMGLRKNGEEYPIRVEAKNIPYQGRQARGVEIRDITKRKRAEALLRHSELRHRVIVENSPMGIVRFGVDGVILDCNENFIRLMGETRAGVIGVNGLHHANKEMQESLRIALSGKPTSFEGYHTSLGNGRTTYLRARLNPVNPGRPPTEVIATVEDFGERKQARDDLRKAKEEAEAYSRSKTEFLTNMSHEIRTPLNGISGMLQLLHGTGLNEEQEEYVSGAIRSSNRLTILLTDILDLARVEAGKLSIVNKPFNVKEACLQVLELYRLTADQSGVALLSCIDPEIPQALEGDALRVQQVLTNLLGNAFKFTESGSVQLSARLRGPTPGRCRIEFTVSDSGIGIPKNKLGTLFESFTQVSQGYTRQHQGAGLGLAICKQLVTLMGGSISVNSELGKGTTVAVLIPFGVTNASVLPQLANRHDRLEKGKPLNILLAEDERVNSMVTRRLLERAGHTVIAVENGLEAIEALAEQPFDVVLLDIQMPVMDGVEAARAIRNGAAGEDRVRTPIAAVTAYAMVGDREEFLEAGMDGYVVKPIELDKLQRFLSSLS